MLERAPARRVRKNRYRKPGTGRSRVVNLLRLVVNGFKLGGMLALLLVVSAIFISGYATVTHSDYFRAETIQVIGNQRLAGDEILAQAGLKQGDNLLAINLRVVRERLLAHPWISSARVSRDIPESITIKVQEHAPLAVLDLGRKFLLNDQGRIFKELGKNDPEHLPLITGIGYIDISLGDDPLSPSMQAALELLGICRSGRGALPYDELAELHMDKEIGATLISQRQGKRFKIGFGEFETKNERLKQILPVLENNSQWCDFLILDANNPDRMVVQLGAIPQANTKGM